MSAAGVDGALLDYSTSILLNTLRELHQQTRVDNAHSSHLARGRIFELILRQLRDPSDILQITGFFDACTGRSFVDKSVLPPEDGEPIAYEIYQDPNKQSRDPAICDGRQVIDQQTGLPVLSKEGSPFGGVPISPVSGPAGNSIPLKNGRPMLYKTFWSSYRYLTRSAIWRFTSASSTRRTVSYRICVAGPAGPSSIRNARPTMPSGASVPLSAKRKAAARAQRISIFPLASTGTVTASSTAGILSVANPTDTRTTTVAGMSAISVSGAAILRHSNGGVISLPGRASPTPARPKGTWTKVRSAATSAAIPSLPTFPTGPSTRQYWSGSSPTRMLRLSSCDPGKTRWVSGGSFLRGSRRRRKNTGPGCCICEGWALPSPICWTRLRPFN